MQQGTLDLPQRNRMSVQRINDHAAQHGIALRQDQLGGGAGSVDHAKLFTCPTLAPLAHSPVFAELTEAQQRRYNQLVALMQNELICFFEQELAGNVLPALLESDGIALDLRDSLAGFLAEEREHTKMFRRLNRLAEPAWYERDDFHILQMPRPFLATIRAMARRPLSFPMVFWMMLLMEERSLMISRRYAAMDPDQLDAEFAAVYRAHAEDEVRHVQVDWHLLERFYETRPRWLRRINAWLLEAMVVGIFLKPRRANVRLVELLIAEFPKLNEKRDRLVRAVRNLADNDGYRAMMYSREATPIGRALFDRLPEFAHLRRRLFKDTTP